MYESIMSGYSDTYPFMQTWQDLLAKADAADQGEPARLSAFLRTGGPDRLVTAEDEGFVQVVEEVYESDQVSCPEGAEGGVCDCREKISESAPFWVTTNEFKSMRPASTDTSCIGYREVDRRTVGVQGNQPEKTPSMGVSAPGNTFALGEYLRRLAFTPLHQQKNAVYEGLEKFYQALAQQSSGTDGDDGDTVVGAQCVYPPGAVYDVRDEGVVVGNPASLRPIICSAVGNESVQGAILRALLEVEGSPFLRAVLGNGIERSKYICEPNSSGAVGPMSRVIGQCSSRSITQNLNLTDNKRTPNICTLTGSLPASIRHVNSLQSQALKENLARGSSAYYAHIAEGYLGRGSCGDLNVPTDGPPARAGDPEDYCAYVARLATSSFRDYCVGQ
jgi:hypothetical protein